MDEVWGGAENAARFYARGGGLAARLRQYIGLVFTAARAAFKIRRVMARSSARAARFVYVPYPAVLTLWFFSLLPRPRSAVALAADCLLSLYDTVALDRKLLAADSLAAKLLLRMEARAFAAADMIFVDTEGNARHYANLTGLDNDKFVVLPLCMNERDFRALRSAPRPAKKTTLLFCGSFVPLQGVEVIVKAAASLRDRGDIRFKFVGDGQTADEVADLIASLRLDNIDWRRDWVDTPAMLREYAEADICLGVFGGTEKAARVWPYKNYQAMAAAKPLISMETDAFGPVKTNPPCYLAVPAADHAALKTAIMELADGAARRHRLGIQAARVVDDCLSAKTVAARLYELFA